MTISLSGTGQSAPDALQFGGRGRGYKTHYKPGHRDRKDHLSRGDRAMQLWSDSSAEEDSVVISRPKKAKKTVLPSQSTDVRPKTLRDEAVSPQFPPMKRQLTQTEASSEILDDTRSSTGKQQSIPPLSDSDLQLQIPLRGSRFRPLQDLDDSSPSPTHRTEESPAMSSFFLDDPPSSFFTTGNYWRRSQQLSRRRDSDSHLDALNFPPLGSSGLFTRDEQALQSPKTNNPHKKKGHTSIQRPQSANNVFSEDDVATNLPLKRSLSDSSAATKKKAYGVQQSTGSEKPKIKKTKKLESQQHSESQASESAKSWSWFGPVYSLIAKIQSVLSWFASWFKRKPQ